jgi:hypothetical protein
LLHNELHWRFFFCKAFLQLFLHRCHFCYLVLHWRIFFCPQAAQALEEESQSHWKGEAIPHIQAAQPRHHKQAAESPEETANGTALALFFLCIIIDIGVFFICTMNCIGAFSWQQQIPQ